MPTKTKDPAPWEIKQQITEAQEKIGGACTKILEDNKASETTKKEVIYRLVVADRKLYKLKETFK